MPIIPLKCTSCGANIQVNSDNDAALCEACGTPFAIKEAIIQNYINNVVTINADTVNVASQKDFVVEGGVLKKYQGEAVEVKVPDNVIKIDRFAFCKMMIKSISIPEGVEEVEIHDCPRLTSINLPSTLKSVLVSGCAELEVPADITFPDSITVVFFNGIKRIKSVVIPKNANVNEIVFEGCVGLESVILPENIMNKENFYFSFKGCSNLKSIAIPNGISGIPSDAFNGCSKLEKVVIPSSVTGIGHDAFRLCSSLKRIILPKGLKSIGSGAFMQSGLEEISIPSGCTVGEGALSGTPFSENQQRIIREEKLKQDEWRAAGLCAYCGGKKSFWDNRCKSCGRLS